MLIPSKLAQRFPVLMTLGATIFLATPTLAQQPLPLVEEIRQQALAYDANLPNYLCKQLVERQRAKANSNSWKREDVFEEEVAYFKGRESYRLLSRNGKPNQDPGKRVKRGMRADSLFGSMLRGLMQPSAKSVFRLVEAPSQTLAGRDTIRLDFQVAKENSKWQTTRNGAKYIRGYHGTLWADRETKAVLRLQMQMEGEPGDPPWLQTTKLQLEYGYLDLAGERHLLPLRAEAEIDFGKERRRNLFTFSDYRQYRSDSTITFDTQQ